MALKVVDRFTVRDGLWEVDPRTYGLTKDKLFQYDGWNIPGKGGASHIFVNAKPGSIATFYTTDGKQNPLPIVVDGSGWCNFNLWASSAYWGDNNGPWAVSVNGVEVARGLGLPDGLHVSTFLIVKDVDEGSQPAPAPVESVSHIQVIVDGVMVFDNRVKSWN